METIKVNMTPCEDVQTIHASQNDNEAREWGFELHNNGEKIDSSSISDQLVFKAYKGGTEQILPENGSVPTTSPIIADIKYPQGLLADQEFLYRQSPTESDGLAKIQTIYGNTLKWNQQILDGNFPSTSNWLANGGNMSVANNVLTVTSTSTSNTTNIRQIGNLSIPAGHKVLFSMKVKSTATTMRVTLRNSSTIGFTSTRTIEANTETIYAFIGETTEDIDRIYIYFNRDEISGTICEFSNMICADLTKMFGSTKADEIYAMEQAQSGSGVAYFRSLFPLPYYQYDSGSLLPFRGNGIKTANEDESEEHNTTLPISTYFPNGMNGVNDVHDELNENNAITRFARVTYNGTESGWALLNSYGVFYITPSNMAFSTNNAVCDSFRRVNKRVSEMLDGDFTTIAGAGRSLWFKKDSITTVADWKTYLSNNPVTVVYELATPTETSFTTASLVTENAEIPLSNEDGILIGKCTEQLSENPGFIDAKIKLADADGECYSNKIQLHVERKPS